MAAVGSACAGASFTFGNELVLGIGKSDGVAAANAWRSGSVSTGICESLSAGTWTGSMAAEASASVGTRRSALAARLVASGLGAGACVIISALTLGTLSRPRMAVAGGPRTREEGSAAMVVAFDKRLSPSDFKSMWLLPGNSAVIKG